MKHKLTIGLILALVFLFSLPITSFASENQTLFTIGLSSYQINEENKAMDAAPFIDNGRTLVPVRYLALALGVSEKNIDWVPSTREVKLSNDKTVIILQVGNKIISVNDKTMNMEVAPIIREDGRTYLPARYVAEAFGYEVGWDDATCSVLIGPPGDLPEPPKPTWTVKYEKRNVENKSVNLVYVNMNNPKIKVKPVLAQNKVGGIESLDSMAQRVGAIAAINGTYFNCYEGQDNLPWGTLALENKYYHLGSNATIGIDNNNGVYIDKLEPRIEGSTDGSWEWPNWWYAWGLNHPQPNGIIIYTPEYKNSVTPPGNAAIIVKNGFVTSIEKGSVNIPADGYVILYGENNNERYEQFKIGTSVDYKVIFNEGKELQFISALSNYPLLVLNGMQAIEEVNDPKMTSQGPRSFIGVSWDNILIIGTADSANVWDLAKIAQSLGLKAAVNLDGGASCGLYYNGSYIKTPGRQLSNCLTVTLCK